MLDLPGSGFYINQMVNYQRSLDATFAALADPTRRGILEQLARGETNVSALAEPYEMSLPAVSKHLRVLERAGLIIRSRQGREHRIRVDHTPIQHAKDWILLYADSVANLARHIEAPV